MAPATLFAIGVFTVLLLALFVYVSVREIARPRAQPVPFDRLLEVDDAAATTRPLRILLAIDGSPCSVAAVHEVARCRLPKGTAVKVLTALHSRVPPVPDPGFSFVAAHAEDLHAQEQRTPEIQAAAVARLRRHRPLLDVTTSIAEGVPKDVILREAKEWRADRIVLGSHSYGRVGRAVLGSTAAAVAAEASCSVLIARPPVDVEHPDEP
jgi:nucleotide-binding universal stress UspA family protein